jgi:hypothetical protein
LPQQSSAHLDLQQFLLVKCLSWRRAISKHKSGIKTPFNGCALMLIPMADVRRRYVAELTNFRSRSAIVSLL